MPIALRPRLARRELGSHGHRVPPASARRRREPLWRCGIQPGQSTGSRYGDAGDGAGTAWSNHPADRPVTCRVGVASTGLLMSVLDEHVRRRIPKCTSRDHEYLCEAIRSNGSASLATRARTRLESDVDALRGRARPPGHRLRHRSGWRPSRRASGARAFRLTTRALGRDVIAQFPVSERYDLTV